MGVLQCPGSSLWACGREGGGLQLGFSPAESHRAPGFPRASVSLSVFSPPESRRILLPVVLHHIHLHLRQQKELLICSGILGSIFSIVKTSSLVVAPSPLRPPQLRPRPEFLEPGAEQQRRSVRSAASDGKVPA